MTRRSCEFWYHVLRLGLEEETGVRIHCLLGTGQRRRITRRRGCSAVILVYRLWSEGVRGASPPSRPPPGLSASPQPRCPLSHLARPFCTTPDPPAFYSLHRRSTASSSTSPSNPLSPLSHSFSTSLHHSPPHSLSPLITLPDLTPSILRP